MSLDREELIAACVRHGRVARVVVAEVRGSAPRDAGTAMLVWEDGQSGTIGGGTLEHELTLKARDMLGADAPDRLTRHALGPDMGQCCGGQVQALTEIFDRARAEALPQDIHARGPGDMPLGVTRLLAQARNGAAPVTPQLIKDWMIEPVRARAQPLWIWGAGHVGRAMVSVLAPLPDLAITWVDTSADRFPEDVPEGVTCLPAADLATLVPYAPTHARHLIVTYSHAFDLALCDALLRHGFDYAGLIGSQTKKARFRKRLSEAGHGPDPFARLTCPIGDPALGKHPQQIALGVAAELLRLPPLCECDNGPGDAIPGNTDKQTVNGSRLKEDRA
jgi:xanthine dehydrogenase accessory factor